MLCCLCWCVSARCDLQHAAISASDLLQNGSDWPNRSCQFQRHVGMTLYRLYKTRSISLFSVSTAALTWMSYRTASWWSLVCTNPRKHTHVMTSHCRSRADTSQESFWISPQSWHPSRGCEITGCRGDTEPEAPLLFPGFIGFTPTPPCWLCFCAFVCSHTLLWPYLAAPAPAPNCSASVCTDSHQLHCQCVSEALVRGVLLLPASCFCCTPCKKLRYLLYWDKTARA